MLVRKFDYSCFGVNDAFNIPDILQCEHDYAVSAAHVVRFMMLQSCKRNSTQMTENGCRMKVLCHIWVSQTVLAVV